LLCQYITDEEGESRKAYHGTQSTDCCIVAGPCLMKESEAMQTKCFHWIFDCLKDIQSDGLRQDGEEPALPP